MAGMAKRAPELFRLDGRVAVVVGGTGVLGGAIARALGEAGAKVAIVGRKSPEAAAAKLAADGVTAQGFTADAMDRVALESARTAIVAALGEPDILVNAAGGNAPEATAGPDRSFFDLPLAGLEKVVALNLFAGAVLPCQVFGKAMADRGGSIINIGSMAAERPLTRVVGYAAAKAAVANFTRWLAVTMARDHGAKLRVNAIAPGFFLTDQNRFLLTKPEGGMTERGASIIAHTPMNRFGDPGDLAGAAVWLAGDASAFVTGTVIPVDGGFSAFSGV